MSKKFTITIPRNAVYAGAILALVSYGSFKGVKKAQSTANQAKQFKELSSRLKSENPQSSGDINALNKLYESRLLREETWKKAVREYLLYVENRVNAIYVQGNFGAERKNTPIILKYDRNNIGQSFRLNEYADNGQLVLDENGDPVASTDYPDGGDYVDKWAVGGYWWA